ncbi:MAG: purine-nucleoside/S-methyl-5-thioadenosine phosphorylase / adenosine deaminase [Candidatus Atribacteria bacterium]|nr:purine-nucleoside/S-methyl-5-thioadenosine phosphorylase / adenosine deaminase [Candidatus Atribacteria bacterium]
MIISERKGFTFFQFEQLLLPRLDHLVTNRFFPFDLTQLEGKNKLAEILNTDEIIFPRQVHGSNLRLVDRASLSWGRGANFFADGLLTAEKRLYLGILVADCFPLLFFDPEKQALSVVHAGWRGIWQGIHLKTLGKMQLFFGSTPSSLIVGIGPGIGKCCFEVRQEVKEYFEQVPARANYIFPVSQNQWKVDLPGILVRELVEAGVRRGQIEIFPACTSCHTQTFYSFRKEGPKAKRFALVAALQ